MTDEENKAIKDAIVLADIGWYGNDRPHRLTLLKLLKRNTYTDEVREMLEGLCKAPEKAVAEFVRGHLGVPGPVRRRLPYGV